MTRTLALVTGLTTFLLCLIAVRERAALVRTGYEVSALERRRERAVMEAATARERLSRLRAPATVARRVAELGLATEYPARLPVVRFRAERRAPRVLVRSEVPREGRDVGP